MTKRILAIILSVTMIVTFLPVFAIATSAEGTTATFDPKDHWTESGYITGSKSFGNNSEVTVAFSGQSVYNGYGEVTIDSANYSTAAITVSAPAGSVISKIVFNYKFAGGTGVFTSASGTMSETVTDPEYSYLGSNEWTGSANSVTFTPTAAMAYSSFVVTYGAAAENVEVTAVEYIYDEAYYDLYLYSEDTAYLFELTEDLVYGKTYTYADMYPDWTCTLTAVGTADIYATDATLTVTKDETDLVHIVGTMTLNGVTHTITYDEQAFVPSGTEYTIEGTIGDTSGYKPAFGFYVYIATTTFNDKTYTFQLALDSENGIGTFGSDKVKLNYCLLYDDLTTIEFCKTASDFVATQDDAGNISVAGSLYVDNGDKYIFNLTKAATTYTVTDGTAAGANGSISFDKTSAAEGETVTVTVDPAEGYQLKTLKYNDGEDHEITKDATTGDYQFTMPAKEVTVTAEFEEIPVSGGKTLPYSFDFETGFLVEGWANVDADGDGHDWITGTDNYVNQGFGMDLSNCAISQSFANNIGSFNSDNWLFSPALVIPEAGATISWYEQSQDPIYPDSYMVYVSECVGEEAVASVYDVATNPTGTTVELYSGVAANPWTQRSVELSAEEYGGKTVYIAFRHLSEDCYWLEIDNFAAEELEATGYGIILDDGTTIPGVKNESQTEFLEYSVQTTLSAGDMFQLYDFDNRTSWTEGNIDDASTPNIAINGYNVYEVSADGTYTFVIKVYDSGYCEVYVGYETATPTHTHSFTYEANDNVLTATCADGCDDGLDENPLTLTLTAPADLAYDGNAKAFTFAAGEADAWTDAGLELPPIIYCIKQSGQSEYMPLLGTLQDVGNYMAQITVDEKTAQVKFAIDKGMPYINTNPVPSDITFGEKLSDSTLFGGYAQVSSTNSTQIAGWFEWTEPDTVPAVADSDVTLYDVTFTPVDEQNYMAVTCQVTITVNHTHAPVLVKGQEPSAVPGFKDYYECACGEYYEDAAGSTLIPDLDAWKAEGGAGYIAPVTYTATYFDGDPVEPGPDTYEEKADGIHVYTFDLIFTGKTDKDLIMESTCDEIYLENMTVGGDLITDGGESSIVVYMTDSTIEGDFIATKGEEEMYPCIHVDGDNVIQGDVISDTTFTVYGEPGATLQMASVTAVDYLVLQNARLDNVKEDYVFGETTTLTPEDESQPITLTVKANVEFESEETFIINDGKPFAFGEELEIGAPTVFDENGEPFDPQPELDVVYYLLEDEGYSFVQVDGVPTEEGDYCVFFAVSEDDPDYCGTASYFFSIGHNIQKVTGKPATLTAEGYKDYYYCEGCDTYFEDEAGETPIEDLEAWKAEGGAGYLAKLKLIDTIVINGFCDPVAGGKVGDYLTLVIPEDAHFHFLGNGMHWYDDAADSFIYDAEALFKDGKMYSIGGELVADEGYVFAANPKVLLNGGDYPVDTAHSFTYSGSEGYYKLWTMSKKATVPTDPTETTVDLRIGDKEFYGVKGGETLEVESLDAMEDITVLTQNGVDIEGMSDEWSMSTKFLDGEGRSVLEVQVFETGDDYVTFNLQSHYADCPGANVDDFQIMLITVKLPTVEKLLGDANDDGLVNMKDVLTIRKVLAGIEVTSYNALNADCNEDGEVNTKDVLMLRKYFAGLIETLGA